ncbi:FliM/FliN family flagellar motor switch protein [Roseibacterium sp. SDUM158016]|uniref:FliM/FliN family flagellar motor switch protein n=1 Tax=Roseicyclus sediminis TaxID=2980997 RepID=UPI0021D0D4B1|nr:FliM/FliN family flagellar motor switch protein [Roseibacterium sp. SDUM158016]MCU4653795.1 FliM/FliN family flagellar motor switch protein [Roseibacterium sp. SDUM158016]
MTQTQDPATPQRASVLSRIVAAHRRGAAEARDRRPELTRTWGRALRHAAVPFRGLDPVLDEVTAEEGMGLARAIAALPDHGLVAALEDREGRRGLLALSHGLVDALIEVQTTGRVEAQTLPPRPVTRIDEALCRDFLDLVLAAFARETDAMGGRDWPERLSFGSSIADRAQLNLLLPDTRFHVLTADLRLGAEGAREGRVVLAVPRIAAGDAGGPPPPGQPEEWREGLALALQEAELDLVAVLLRTRRPLCEVEALKPGDLIGFDASDLARVRLETPAGQRVMTARLGQVRGQRALRLDDGAVGVRSAVVGEGPAMVPMVRDLPPDHGPTPVPVTAPAPMPAPPGAMPGSLPMVAGAHPELAQAEGDLPLDFAPGSMPVDPSPPGS